MLKKYLTLASISLLAACSGGSNAPVLPETPAGQGQTQLEDVVQADNPVGSDSTVQIDTPAIPDTPAPPEPPIQQRLITTDSGLQYEVLKATDGPKPGKDSVVTVDYVGTLTDGTEFDSSYARGRPATFSLARVIRGWTEGVQLMSVGSQYRFVIPANLAYGDRGAGSIIKPGDTLVFEVELLEINSN